MQGSDLTFEQKTTKTFSELMANNLEGEKPMRRVLVVLAFLRLRPSRNNVWATTVWGIQPDNYFNMDGVYPNITTPQDSGGTPSPTDGKDGYIWLKTGSASPQLFSATATVAVYYKNNSGTSDPYTFLETETANCGYPGQFLSTGPIGTWGTYLEWGGGNNIAIDDPNFLVTGSEKIETKDLEDAYVTWQQGTFYLQMWTCATLAMPWRTLPAARRCLAYTWRRHAPFPIDLGPGGEAPVDMLTK